MPALAVHPCQQVCSWLATPERRELLRVFRCTGCGSEWTADQSWRPADRHGEVPEDVRRELRRQTGSSS